jgi:twitching motility protein PilT
MGESEKRFLQVLQLAVQNKTSDIHLMAGQPPALRTHEGVQPINTPAFTAEEFQQILQLMITEPALKATIHEIQDYDGSFEVKGLGRFRFNVYRSNGAAATVLRVIGTVVPTIDELKLPQVLKKIADASRGLVLVTGATGSGKSSTLAAMIDHLNSSQALHILTIEDPVEFLHSQKKSRVSQREIGRDTDNFAIALKSALRQDPDVILVGEMRDYETLDIALKAAETGHLVFSTVHTSDAMKTVGRLISLFPPAEQTAARNRLADNLHAIISQRLVPSKKGGKIVAQEILINNLAIQECIANEKKTSEIPGFVEKGREVLGMQTFDQHMADLVRMDQITVETALAFATNPSDFQRNLSFGETAVEDDGSSLGVESLPVAPSLQATTSTQSVAPTAKPAPAPSVAPARPAAGPMPAPPQPGASAAGTKPNIPKIPKLPGAA